MLGQIHLAHAAGTEPLLEPILAELPGGKRFAAQRADRVHADDGDHHGNAGDQNLAADKPTVLEPLRDLAHCRNRGPQIDEGSNGHQCHRGRDDRGSLPRIGNEHGIREDQ